MRTLLTVFWLRRRLAQAPTLPPVLAFGLFAAMVVSYRWSLKPAARSLSERRDDLFHALGDG